MWRVQVKRGFIARRDKLVVDEQLSFNDATHNAY
jgi:hypothetical protein